jgi:hypothetical protein
MKKIEAVTEPVSHGCHPPNFVCQYEVAYCEAGRDLVEEKEKWYLCLSEVKTKVSELRRKHVVVKMTKEEELTAHSYVSRDMRVAKKAFGLVDSVINDFDHSRWISLLVRVKLYNEKLRSLQNLLVKAVYLEKLGFVYS